MKKTVSGFLYPDAQGGIRFMFDKPTMRGKEYTADVYYTDNLLSLLGIEKNVITKPLHVRIEVLGEVNYEEEAATKEAWCGLSASVDLSEKVEEGDGGM